MHWNGVRATSINRNIVECKGGHLCNGGADAVSY